MDSTQRPLLGEQQGQEQQPTTTYARDPLDRLLWDCVANGALTHNGRHLTEPQLQWVVGQVRHYDGQGDAEAAVGLRDDLNRRNIVLGGELLGTILTPARQPERCLQIVRAVRRGR